MNLKTHPTFDNTPLLKTQAISIVSFEQTREEKAVSFIINKMQSAFKHVTTSIILMMVQKSRVCL